jgi:hypothetical protein
MVFCLSLYRFKGHSSTTSIVLDLIGYKCLVEDWPLLRRKRHNRHAFTTATGIGLVRIIERKS